jgi:hypothetical protein
MRCSQKPMEFDHGWDRGFRPWTSNLTAAPGCMSSAGAMQAVRTQGRPCRKRQTLEDQPRTGFHTGGRVYLRSYAPAELRSEQFGHGVCFCLQARLMSGGIGCRQRIIKTWNPAVAGIIPSVQDLSVSPLTAKVFCWQM